MDIQVTCHRGRGEGIESFGEQGFEGITIAAGAELLNPVYLGPMDEMAVQNSFRGFANREPGSDGHVSEKLPILPPEPGSGLPAGGNVGIAEAVDLGFVYCLKLKRRR